MPPKRSKNKAGVQVRTVQDVEVWSPQETPASPPATEEDRANFQKLLFQMNGMGLGKKEESSKTDTQKGPTAEPKLNGEASPKKRPKKKPQTPASEKVKQDTSTILLEEQPSEEQSTISKNRRVKKAVKPAEVKDVTVECTKKTTRGASNQSEIEHGPVPTNTPPAAVVREPMSRQRQLSTSNQVDSSIAVDNDRSKRPGNSALNGRESHTGRNESRGRKSPKPSDADQLRNRDKPQIDVHDLNPMLLLQAALNFILPKKKDPTSFECHPCDKVFVDVERHFEKQRENHRLKWKSEMRRQTVEFLPQPSPEHIRLLDELVQSVEKSHGIPIDQQKLAYYACERLNAIATSNFPGCKVRWFGSHASGIALSTNDLLNMDVLVPNKEEAAATFLKFITAVELNSNFEDLERVVDTNFAHANLTDKNSGSKIQLSLNNTGAYNTSKLISDYVLLDSRVRPLCIFFRLWGKLCEVDRGEEGSWQGHAFPLMVIHYLQQVAVLPVLHEFVENPDGNPEIYLDPKDLNGRWVCQNKLSVGSLLLGLLQYYTVKHDVENHVVTVTQLAPFPRSETKWQAKRIAVIDPFQPKHNISRYITANMYDYVQHCLLATTCALGIPRSEAGPIFGFISTGPDASLFHRCPETLEEYHNVCKKVYELVIRVDERYECPHLRMDNEKCLPEISASLSNSHVFKFLHDVLKIVPSIPVSQSSKPVKNSCDLWSVTPHQASTLVKYFRTILLKFKFEKDIFTDKEKPPLSCTSCHRSGHLRSVCPDEIIPSMAPLPSPSQELCRVLDELCDEVLEIWSSGPVENRLRHDIQQDLWHYLNQFYPDIEVHLFGSSCNGFGGKSSDIDVCLTFQSNATGEGLNFPQLVEEISQRLKGHRNVFRLLPITTAKVPIVKFEYGRSHIQVDMSMYNMLGIRNTQLLRAYSSIDPRVRPLVYMSKRFAKTTGIGDASKGSLSSYAYSLMTLYFLQQVQPPVIPVLQELTDPGVVPPVEIVENANVYFYKNLENLDKVWPHRMKNKSSIGELWLQLLVFYSSDQFHNSQKIVCIRKQDPLYKFDKLWTSRNICIEDPFDLSHNLGSGLSRRMNIFIVKTFQRAAKHFSRMPSPEIAQKFKSLEQYFFDEAALSVGKPPSDRGCHFCHCIGHVQNDCPKRLMMRRNAGGGMQGIRGNDGNRANNQRPGNNFNQFPNRNNNRDNNRNVNHQNQVGRTTATGHRVAPGQFYNAPNAIGHRQASLNVNQMRPMQGPMPVKPPPGFQVLGPPLIAAQAQHPQHPQQSQHPQAQHPQHPQQPQHPQAQHPQHPQQPQHSQHPQVQLPQPPQHMQLPQHPLAQMSGVPVGAVGAVGPHMVPQPMLPPGIPMQGLPPHRMWR